MNHILRHAGENLWASEADVQKGRRGRRFHVRLHDPTRGRLHLLMRTLREDCGLSSEGRVAAIEISVDWYPKSQSERDRLLMTDLLWRHLLPPEEIWRKDLGWPRSLIKKGGKKTAIPLLANPKAEMKYQPRPYAGVELKPNREAARSLIANFHLQPGVDSTVWFGPEVGDAHIRVMHKIMDQQHHGKKTKVDLNEKERRARIEVTLRGQALRELGLSWTRELSVVQFEKLTGRYFTFWLATVPHHQGRCEKSEDILRILRGREELGIFARTGVFGLQEYERAFHRRKREARRRLSLRGAPIKARERAGEGKDGFRLAFTQLNERVHDALRRLRWDCA